MKSFTVAAFAGAASAAWAPPAYGGQSSPVASSSSAPPAEEYSQPPSYESSASAYMSSTAATTSSAAWGYSAPAYGASSSSSMATYACNPAHSYPYGAQCVSTYGTLSLVTPSPSTPGSYGTGSVPSHPMPTGGYGGNGTAPSWGGNGGSWGHGGDSSVTQIVTSYETYCPGPTTVTMNSKTYTVTEATTLTITDCPCQITKPAESITPVYTTEVVTDYTTVCPYSTQITYGSTTHTATAGETVTVSQCPAEGCTVTKEVPQTWVVPTMTTYCPKPEVPTTITVGTQTYPVSEETTLTLTAPTSVVTYTSVFSQPEQPTSYVQGSVTYPYSEATTIYMTETSQGGYTVTAPYSSIWTAPAAASTPVGPVGGAQPSGYAPSVNGSSPVSPAIPQQTGNGAEKLMAGGVAVAAVIGALFL